MCFAVATRGGRKSLKVCLGYVSLVGWCFDLAKVAIWFEKHNLESTNACLQIKVLLDSYGSFGEVDI